MAVFEWFYSLPLTNVEWGARELGAALKGMLFFGSRRTKSVARLEGAVRERTGAVEAIAFERGRCALRWVLEMARARDEGSGRTEVVFPSLLCKAVPDAVRAAGLEPVLSEVTEDLAMDPAGAEEIFDPDRTLAVIVPQIYGFPTPLEPFRGMAKEGGAVVIDDAAAAFGGVLDGKPLGLQGDAGIYSFSQGKTATAGGGGFVVMSGSSPFFGALKHRAPLLPALPGRAGKTFRRFVWFDALHRFADPLETIVDYLRVLLGGTKKFPSFTIEHRRMAGLQANLALVQLERLDAMFKQRRENIAHLRSELDGIDGLRVVNGSKETVPTRFLVETMEHEVVRKPMGISEENPLVVHLRKHGIEARYAYLPLHLHEGVAARKAPCLEMSERLGKRLLALPYLPPLGRGEMARIGKAVRSFFGS